MDGISSYNHFLALHKPQLLLSEVPEHFWPILHKKIRDVVFDSGSSFQLFFIDYEGKEKKLYDPLWTVQATRDIDCNNPTNIFLIDHAWTFEPQRIKVTLSSVPSLLARMCSLMGVTDTTPEEQVEKVSESLWRYAQCYALSGGEFSVEERMPIWYILDEFGSAITHSNSPNFRAVPFLYVPDEITYTLLFPTRNVASDEIITRNYVEGKYSYPLQREAMLIPWIRYHHFDLDYRQTEPNEIYFLEGHMAESLPNLTVTAEINRPPVLKVYSEYRFINEHLTTPEFQIVHNENDADILWYTSHFKNYLDLSENSPHKFVNQFPFEYVITIKDLCAIIARRCSNINEINDELATGPAWLPTTYNMSTELPILVAYYMQRKRMGLNNLWLCKPYNLARSLDTYITDNLHCLCRMPLSGPKIAQKYIENPVLFQRPDVGHVKFDIRYVLLLNSVSPTEVYIYNNFFLRFANQAFELQDFDNYQKHFTVMNYSEGVSLYKLLCSEFKEEWGKQYGNFNWDDIEQKIFKMFSEFFTAATSREPPCGIAKNPQSRALYAADVMLAWCNNDNTEIQPKLLEINWMPDCRRACEYYPNFYNDIFTVMFLNKEVDTCTKIL